MSSFCVRKVEPVADPVSGEYPGTYIQDANNGGHAVQQYGALPGKSVAAGDKFSVIAIEVVAFVGVSATLSYTATNAPILPANGE